MGRRQGRRRAESVVARREEAARPSAPAPIPPGSAKVEAALAVSLVAAVVVAYARVAHYPFISYDDTAYVVTNPHVQAGLTWESVKWAFSTFYANNWHPLTWLSHMLDCQLFGMEAGRHHLQSVLLHAASTVLLLRFLCAAIGNPWASALVAGVFALHPAHVESVAWIAERKDVLSALFFMATLLAWLRWVRRPSGRAMAVVLVAFTLGLLAKPMLVTLPFVLLLVDAWPLGRWELVSPRWAALWPLLVEKLPLFALAAASSVVTWLAQQSGGAVQSVERFPLASRIATAAIAYVRYLGEAFWPARLALFYPSTRDVSLGWGVLAALFLLAITAAVVLLGRRRPWIPVGWLWFVGMLVPVIGLVQVGQQSMADRYTYLPYVGLSIAVVWLVTEAVTKWPRFRIVAAAAAIVALAMLGWRSWVQVSYWRDTVPLFEHAIAVTTANFPMENNLGGALMRRGRHLEAVAHFTAALQMSPDYVDALLNRGAALEELGRVAEAQADYEAAVRILPTWALAHFNLGALLHTQGHPAEAIPHYEEALRLRPDYVRARTNLAGAFYALARVDEAATQLEAALRLDPTSADAHDILGAVRSRQGRQQEAIREYEEVLRLRPNDARVRETLERLRRLSGARRQ